MDESTKSVTGTDADAAAPSNVKPAWRLPEVTILDVERGTITTTGPYADGNGSTS